jgi:isoleucyl-tRNA synthetase
MYDFKKVEEGARKVWKKYKKEIEKAIQEDPKKKLFSFLEGPPTANAPPALHHLEVRTFKDIICKFKYMQGFSVPRKGGWDCHGLPVEVQIEKKLGLESKKDVLKYGVGKFINDARNSVFSYIKDWNKSTEELAYWVDLKNPYVTLQNDYIESVWWSLKELYDKGMLYEGYKVVPFCPRCGTPLSSHEVALGYKDVKEESVYIAFKLKDKKGEYILAWTTTPWTLPGNVALAVGKDIDYVKVKLSDGDFLILGKDRLDVIKGDYEIVKEMKGKELEGLEYEPLFDIKETQNKNSHKVILADFVTTEDGTGVVHTAVMYGEDDYNVGIEKGLPAVHTVGQDGKFLDIVPKFAGKFVKDAEKDIIQDLKTRHLLLKTEKITHSYPFCWRCDSILLYYAINSWFIKVSKVKEKLLKLNKNINWYPGHIKEGRFGKWLESAKDWALSRFKFWGSPLPIWRCECGEEKAIGSVEELKKNASKKLGKEIDLHKPWIDNVKLKCKCGKEMTRIPDVIDCWYDSGSASFAQFHYPFENKKEFEKRFPYDFIAEAIDQTRGWFYTLHVLGAVLFDKPAYKNVICAGHVVDEKGEKMSKSKGNIIKPDEMIGQTGVDAVRLQFCTSDAGNQKRFSYNLMKESVIPFLTVLYNCNNYYNQAEKKKAKNNLEDKWIISRLNTLIKEVTKDLENYSLNDPFEKLLGFVIKEFSRGYIQITRDRDDTREILGEVLEKLSLLIAPFAPYISEHIHQNFDKNSVHLSKWPKADEKKIDKKLEEKFAHAFSIIEKGLAERDKAQIGLKWPLAKAKISGKEKLKQDLQDIVMRQLNVKKLEFIDGETLEIELDIKLTPELEAEGYAREISRAVQAERKKKGLVKSDKIKLLVSSEKEFLDKISKEKEMIMERTNAKTLDLSTEKVNGVMLKIKKYNVAIVFNKI